MKIGMIGLGNMGTAIANNIAKNGHEVYGWEFFEDIVKEINEKHTNSKYLAGIPLSPHLKATRNMEEAVKGMDIIFVGLPSLYIKKILPDCGKAIGKDTIIVNLSKGIEDKTCYTAGHMLSDFFKGHQVVILSGPSVANEFAQGLPCGVVIAGDNKETLCKVAHAIETPKFRTRFSNDKIGVEWSGILKNMYAIGLGIIHGVGIDSINFKASYLTRAIEEMADVIEAIGGQRKTVYYLAGLGDLIATSLSEHSHNRRLGELLSKGLTFEQAKKELGVLPEGLRALLSATYLAEKYHTAMPVAEGILKVIDGKIKPQQLVEDFMFMGV
jgi:glycerol-3-phosphate dehydrogenase (NAD(P)+)